MTSTDNDDVMNDDTLHTEVDLKPLDVESILGDKKFPCTFCPKHNGK